MRIDHQKSGTAHHCVVDPGCTNFHAARGVATHFCHSRGGADWHFLFSLNAVPSIG
jgi:hypothetical protein